MLSATLAVIAGNLQAQEVRTNTDSHLPPVPTTNAIALAEQAYWEARKAREAAPESTEAAWKLARACFDLGEVAPNNSVRSKRAQEGIAAAREAIGKDEKVAAAYYYLGLNLGQLARTKWVGALKLLKEMESAWKKAIQLDAGFDYAGGHRSLGMLYRDAPGWPASIGSQEQAMKHLERAVELAPEYPDNWLALLEAYWSTGRPDKARARIPDAEKAIASARERFTGPAWTSSWADWDARLDKIRQKLRLPG